MKNTGFLLLLITGVALLRCSEKLAGAGSETTNSIAGSIRNADDTPAPNTIVKLFPDDYDPVSNDETKSPIIDTTDNEGTFSFKRINSGSYTILARNDRTATSLLIRDIPVKNNDSLITVPPGNLFPAGSIATDFSENRDSASGYLYIPGTDIFSFVNDNGSAMLDNVPSGKFSTVIHATADGKRRNILRGEVTVMPGRTVTIGFTAWKYARRILLNTASNGAGVTDDQYGFPVLIRLKGSNFNFAEALPSGNDLLFTKSDNTQLPFEIERWDAAGNRAEIWVKIDTIHGNDSGQSITMYWGNPDAVRESASGPVFNADNGFQGVWHLGDAVNDSIRDATNNQYHGIASGSAASPVAEGVIGNCRSFDGSGNYITMPNTAGGKLNFTQNGIYTVSAWVTADTFDGLSHVIVSKGNFQYFLWLTPIHLNSTLWEFAEYRNNSGWDLSVQPAKAKQWVLLTGVRNGTSQYLYVNGELADTLIDFPFVDPRNTGSDLLIGRFHDLMISPNNDGRYCPFNGRIDEVRISSNARSAGWIKLCYMNQRTDDQLIIFK